MTRIGTEIDSPVLRNALPAPSLGNKTNIIPTPSILYIIPPFTQKIRFVYNVELNKKYGGLNRKMILQLEADNRQLYPIENKDEDGNEEEGEGEGGGEVEGEGVIKETVYRGKTFVPVTDGIKDGNNDEDGEEWRLLESRAANDEYVGRISQVEVQVCNPLSLLHLYNHRSTLAAATSNLRAIDIRWGVDFREYNTNGNNNIQYYLGPFFEMFQALDRVSFHLPALESNPIVSKMKMVEKAVALMGQPEVSHFNLLFGVKAKLAMVDTESIVSVKITGDLERVIWRREPRTWFWQAETGRFLMAKSLKRRRAEDQSSVDCGTKDFSVRPQDYGPYIALMEKYAKSR